ncbi:hypothetical protein [Erythrobacter sp. THAF29]|uniref:hypothetical protein n=1 Tax=Erythrobacter sp. THAF29 TaxID=2587851 RepID=UPI0012A82330|nr:hypothetical protein [Erythrobacter sp. THAF29]QFT78756.1 hypothetical protein FIU90_14495 [Erythrobacter sp. THAF29]
MSQQLALSSLFSVLALASLCLMARIDLFGGDGPSSAAGNYSVQAEISPGLGG